MKSQDRQPEKEKTALDEIAGVRNAKGHEKSRLMGLDFLITELDRDFSLLAGEMVSILTREGEETLAQYLERHPEDYELIFGDSPVAEQTEMDRGESDRQNGGGEQER